MASVGHEEIDREFTPIVFNLRKKDSLESTDRILIDKQLCSVPCGYGKCCGDEVRGRAPQYPMTIVVGNARLKMDVWFNLPDENMGPDLAIAS